MFCFFLRLWLGRKANDYTDFELRMAWDGYTHHKHHSDEGCVFNSRDFLLWLDDCYG